MVEDDDDLVGMLDQLLTGEGYAVEWASDGHIGLHRALTRRYDVIVIDRGLPGIEGIDLVGRLRQRGLDTPILILSALGTARDRVSGLDVGAEDYLAKPFDVDELLARLRSLRRRHLRDAELLPLGERLRLDTTNRSVLRDDKFVTALSERESALLSLLASRPTVVFTREQLRDLVFTDAGSDAAVDTYVYYLRRKLGRKIVVTVRGVGYQLGIR